MSRNKRHQSSKLAHEEKPSWASFMELQMRKTERFAFKLTPEDRLALGRLADSEGEQAAVVIRRLIREAIVTLETSSESRNKSKSSTKHSTISIST